MVTNNNDYSVNITWYLDHPLPELIRANRTNIPSLSWVTLEPKYLTHPYPISPDAPIIAIVMLERENLSFLTRSSIDFIIIAHVREFQEVSFI